MTERFPDLVVTFKKKFGLSQNYSLPDDTVRALRSAEVINDQIDDPTIRPLVDNTPTPEAIELWRNQFLSLFSFNFEEWGEVADVLLTSLKRIPQDVFEAQLVAAYQAAIPHIETFGDSTRFLMYSGGRNRSNTWVKAIAQEHLPDDPYLKLPTIDYFDEAQAGKYQTGIIFDDASYSANQVTGHLDSGSSRLGMEKFIVIYPYMTKYAVDELTRHAGAKGLTVDIFNLNSIPTVDQLLDPEIYDKLQLQGTRRGITKGQGLTYFAHKVPDERSFLPFIGYPRAAEVSNQLNALVPKSAAVYHTEYLQKVANKSNT